MIITVLNADVILIIVSHSPTGAIANPKIKTRVREDLRQILLLARIRAIAKLSQFESAKKDALQLLPMIFFNKSPQGLKTETPRRLFFSFLAQIN
jgi:hypothetical protein